MALYTINMKKFTVMLGSLFLVVGILGFIPEASTSDIDGTPLLFSLFSVDVIQNIIHIVTGIVGLFGASSQRYSRWFLQIFGIAYVLFSVIGWLQGDSVLGLFGVNAAVNISHAVLGILMFGLSLIVPRQTSLK
jgi:hypothetical protein